MNPVGMLAVNHMMYNNILEKDYNFPDVVVLA
jgi:hypothetical protein